MYSMDAMNAMDAIMNMGEQAFDVLVAAGTTEAHDAISVLQTMGLRVLATVATDLGSQVLDDLKAQGAHCLVGRLDKEAFVSLIEKSGVKLVVDATHPFAVDVTRTLLAAVKLAKGTSEYPKYIRYTREMADYDYDQIIHVADAAGAASALLSISGNFLLTTGANTVQIYKGLIPDFDERGYVRVLNTEASIRKCQETGVPGTHVIAKNPPFSEADNDALIQELDIKAMVSKDSGVTGGLYEKIASAKRAGIPMILIDRPLEETGVSTKEDLALWLGEHMNIEKHNSRRFMIVGTNSGCGKTTITCAIMKALKNRGLAVAPFKCGPDYIDPMFHKHITGAPSVNLDLFFLEKDRLNWIFDRHLQNSDIGVVEGVMGMYDGIGTGTCASSYAVAMATGTPMILVVNARGMSASVAALIQGYKNFAGDGSLVKGVILNHVGKGMYMFLKKMIEDHTGVKVLGYFEKQDKAVLESRHLGLITAEEIVDLDEKVELLAAQAENSIDLDALLALADEAAPIEKQVMPWEAKVKKASEGETVKLAVAMDKAFCFYYEDNLQLFKDLGIEICPFAPMAGEVVPEGVDGLYLGGGYPELYAKELSEYTDTLQSVRDCYEKGMPIMAECGGFMYLHEAIEDLEGQISKMAGIIPGVSRLTKKLGPFGYVDVTLDREGLLGQAGVSLKGHEFHYSESDNTGSDMTLKKNNGKTWQEGHVSDNLYAGYPHLYLYSNVDTAIAFKEAMADYHKRYQ